MTYKKDFFKRVQEQTPKRRLFSSKDGKQEPPEGLYDQPEAVYEMALWFSEHGFSGRTSFKMAKRRYEDGYLLDEQSKTGYKKRFRSDHND
jgi:hypothetical protein